jgi:hypothetical protein
LIADSLKEHVHEFPQVLPVLAVSSSPEVVDTLGEQLSLSLQSHVSIRELVSIHEVKALLASNISEEFEMIEDQIFKSGSLNDFEMLDISLRSKLASQASSSLDAFFIWTSPLENLASRLETLSDERVSALFKQWKHKSGLEYSSVQSILSTVLSPSQLDHLMSYPLDERPIRALEELAASVHPSTFQVAVSVKSTCNISQERFDEFVNHILLNCVSDKSFMVLIV